MFFVALVTHRDITVVSAEEDLLTARYDSAVRRDARVYGLFRSARAYRLYLRCFAGNLLPGSGLTPG